MDVEDVSHVLMQLDNGVFATYQQCHFTPDAWRNYTIIGTQGRIENVGDRAEIVLLWNRRCEQKPEGDMIFDMRSNAPGHGGADSKIVREFLNFVVEGTPTLTSPIEARNSIAAGYLATESLRNGSCPKTVPPVDPKVARYFSK